MSTEILPNGYLICQVIIISLGLWAMIVKNNSEPVYLLSIITCLTIILDSILIGVSWNTIPAELKTHRYKFSSAISILLVIAKPFLSFALFVIARIRDGQTSEVTIPSFGNWQTSGSSSQQEQEPPLPQYSQNFSSGGYQST